MVKGNRDIRNKKLKHYRENLHLIKFLNNLK